MSPIAANTMSPEEMAALYRSEAFAEDVEDLIDDPLVSYEPGSRRSWVSLIYGLPLAIALVGSASALVWV